MLPVEVIEFDEHEVPMGDSFIVKMQGVVEDGDVAMIRKAEVANDSFLAFLQHEVEDAVVDEAVFKQGHGVVAVVTASDVMQEIIVQVIGPEFLERVVEHLNGCLATIVVHVRHLGRYLVGIAGMAAKGDAGGMFRTAFAVHGRGVEEVYAVFEGIVYLAVDHFLVDFAIAVLAG